MTEKRKASFRATTSAGAETVTYTDGSAAGGIQDGGSAVIIMTCPFENPMVRERLQAKNGKFTCSFEKVLMALLLAARWIADTAPVGRVMMGSDSQSDLSALEKHSQRWTLCDRSSTGTKCRPPCNGNEEAETIANRPLH